MLIGLPWMFSAKGMLMANRRLIAFVSVLSLFGGVSTHTYATNIILNGGFEANSASTILQNQTNYSNAALSAAVDNVVGFGTAEEIDVYNVYPFHGPPQSGDWFFGLNCRIGSGPNEYDAFSFLLSAPVEAGATYGLSFFAKGHPFDPSGHVQIGLSSSETEFGTPIFTGVATNSVTWDQFDSVFIAQSNASFLTVRADPDFPGYSLVDSFSLSTIPEPTSLTLAACALLGLAVRRKRRA